MVKSTGFCNTCRHWCRQTFLALVWLCCMAGTGYTQTGNTVLDTRITLKTGATHLATVLEALQKQCSTSFSFDKVETAKVKLDKVSWEGISLRQSLEELRRRTGLSYQVIGNNIAFRMETQPGKQTRSGKLSGKVVDEENGEPVMGATVKINGQYLVAGIEGTFMADLPAGKYMAEVTAVGYTSKQVDDVVVAAETSAPLQLVLKRVKGQLAGVMVRSSARLESIAALYVRQKNAAGITDGISAEQIARTPDKNIGESLKRVSGLSTVDNKYVVVRGLSERYNGAILNGQLMPSTELNRKQFSFDIIPSNMVDHVTVIKTLTPDMSAEFGGGLVEVSTKDIPTEDFITVSFGATYNEKTTGKQFRAVGIEGRELLASIPQSRQLFGKTDWKTGADVLNNGMFLPSDRDGNTLINASTFTNNWGLHSYRPGLSPNFQVSAGKVMALPKSRQLGVTAAISYRNTWLTQDLKMSRDGFNGVRPTGETERYGFEGKHYGFSTNIAGLAGVGYSTAKTKIGLQATYFRLLEQNLVLGSTVPGTAGDLAANGYYDVMKQTSLGQYQLKGEHGLGKRGIRLNWAGCYMVLDRQMPDSHIIQFETVDNGKDNMRDADDFNTTFIASNGISKGALRTWSRGFEKDLSWNTDLTLPFNIQAGKLNIRNSFKTGYAGWNKDRTFWVLNTGTSTDAYDAGMPAPLSEVFDPAVHKVDIYQSRFGSDYNSAATLHALYGMMDNRFGKYVRLVWGLRGEYYNMNRVNPIIENIKTTQANNNDKTDYSALYGREPNWNWFPSANLTYSVTPQINLRLAYSKSIVRPDLRELSLFSQYDFELGGDYRSESVIKSTRIKHYDFRFEWYPGAGEVISMSLFYKNLDHPMEIFKQGDNRLYQLSNSASAVNKGIEVEARKSMAFTRVPVLKNITLYGNFTRLYATVVPVTDYIATIDLATNKYTILEKTGEEQERPQAGASNYLANGGLYYDTRPFSVSLNYNYVSNRTYLLVKPGYNALFERPLTRLDLQLALRVLKQRGEIKLNISNLLNSAALIYSNDYQKDTNTEKPTAKEMLYQQGIDFINYETKPGRTYGLTFSYKFK